MRHKGLILIFQFRDNYSITEYCCISVAKEIDGALAGKLGDTMNPKTEEKDTAGEEEEAMSCFNKICCVLCLPVWIPYIIRCEDIVF